MNSHTKSKLGSRAALIVGVFCLVSQAGCDKRTGGAYAKRVETPKELIGGPGALGDVNDWKIGNTLFQVIIQDKGWSRGFGIFGGGIIDADLMRPGSLATDAGGGGRDNFGEAFPALFLRAFDVSDQEAFDIEKQETVRLRAIEIIADGSDGGPAILRTRATGGDFLTLVSDIVNLAVPSSGLAFETDYIVHPGTRHVEIVGRLINRSFHPIDLSGSGLGALLSAIGVEELQIPLGDVLLFGAGNDVFAPGAVEQVNPRLGEFKPVGFDLRFSVDASYAVQGREGVSLPALPGLVTDFLATAGPGVSYGYAVAESERNYAWLNREQYNRDAQTQATKSSLLIPFLISSFTGAFFEVPPATLAPSGQDGSIYEYRRYFIIGNGDVASIRDELFRIRGAVTGTFEGEVRNAQTGIAEREAWIHILDHKLRPYSQAQTDADGKFRADLEPGTYHYRVTAPGRYPFPESPDEIAQTAFNIEANGGLRRFIQLPAPAELAVQVRDETGRLIPAKISVVSTYSEEFDGLIPNDFLFEYWLGEHRRNTDLSWFSNSDNKPRQFVEAVLRTGSDGFVVDSVRHSRCVNGAECERVYDLYVSRGMEYDVHVERGVRLKPGQRTYVEARLSRVVDTTDYISTDLHIHTRNSVDSFAGLRDQVRQAASEGLEILVATDHNFVTDFKPSIAASNMQDFVGSVVGVEVTTLEMGHFNAFPVAADLSSASRFPFVDYCFPPLADKTNGTSFDWVLCNPGQVFNHLRSLASHGPDNIIVQVNHPRDTILGYFNQFYVNPYTAEAEVPTGANYPEVEYFIYPHRDRTGQFEPEQFTLDFDAIEVMNGKRQDQLHAFRLGAQVPASILAEKRDFACGAGHPHNAPGAPLLRQGGHLAFPGAVDDWMNILNISSPKNAPVATGNSDSHGTDSEIGVPRTFVHLDRVDDEPRDAHPSAVSPLDVVEALRKKRVLITNGPFVEMTVRTRAADTVEPPCASFDESIACASDGCEWVSATQVCVPPERVWHVGQTVTYAGDGRNRPIEFNFRVQSAPWVRVNRLLVYANGDLVQTLPIPTGSYPDGRNLDDDIIIPWVRQQGFTKDTVVVVEAYGDNNLFPMITPREEPPTNIGEALGGLAGGLGVDVSGFAAGDGVSAPSFIQSVTPYALSNPIWLDLDGDGQFTPPGNDAGPGPAPVVACDDPSRSIALKPTPTPMELLFHQEHRPAHYPVWDIRKLFPLHEKH